MSPNIDAKGTAKCEKAEPEDWATPREALSIVFKRCNLKNTVRIALIVGTILFIINQLDVLLRGQATWAVWLKICLTYFVPFIVSNLGILTVTKRKPKSTI